MTDDDLKTALAHDVARRTVEPASPGANRAGTVAGCSVPGCTIVASALVGQDVLCLRHATERKDAVYWCRVPGCTRAAKYLASDGIPLCAECKASRDKARVIGKERTPAPCTSCHKAPCDGSALGCAVPKPAPKGAEPPAADKECAGCGASFGHVSGCGSAPPPPPGAKEPLEDYRLIARRIALLAFRRAEQTLDQLILPPESVKLAGDLLNLADRALCLEGRK